MTIIRLEELTPAEIAACTEYYADATLLHACAQGWGGQFPDSQRLQAFLDRCAPLVQALDRAIQKFEVSEDGVVFSGHGRGLSVIGSLYSASDRFIGLTYCYPGYTSTNADRGTAENFLRTRAAGARTPVLMEFRLRKGQRILPMSIATLGQGGEAEYLLGRAAEFQIVEADFVTIQDVDQNVLHLVLA